MKNTIDNNNLELNQPNTLAIRNQSFIIKSPTGGISKDTTPIEAETYSNVFTSKMKYKTKNPSTITKSVFGLSVLFIVLK